jgi:hypothetical protein
LSSPSGSLASKISVPGTKSKNTERLAWAVPPLGLTATMLRTFVPPVTGTSMLKEPLGAAAETIVVAEFASVFVVAT